MFNTLLMSDNYEDRKVDRSEVIIGDTEITVSTVQVYDSSTPFETAIFARNSQKMSEVVVIKNYDSLEEAEIGHTQVLSWVNNSLSKEADIVAFIDSMEDQGNFWASKLLRSLRRYIQVVDN